MQNLSTKDAETIYHIPAASFAEWCREGKLHASKVSGEWQMAISDIDAFLAANPALRPAPTQGENREGACGSGVWHTRRRIHSATVRRMFGE